MRWYVHIFLCLFPLLSTLSQTHELRFQHYSHDDGLSQSLVYRIVQTRDGYLWFATEDGLNRFDGQRFKVYRKRSEPNALSWSFIYDIEHDPATGRLWVATLLKGLNVLDPATDSIIPAPRATSRLKLPDEGVGAVCILRDEVLVGTDKGLSILHKRSLEVTRVIHHASPVLTIISDSLRGKAFAFCENGDMLVLDLNTQGLVVLAAADYLGPGGHALWKAYRTADGAYWLCTASGLFHAPSSLHLRPGGVARFSLTYEGVDYSDRQFYAVYQDRRGRYWITADSVGMFLLDRRFQVLRLIRHESDNVFTPADNNIYQVFEDAQDNLWFATEKGVDRISRVNPAIRSYGQEDRRLRDIFNRVFSLAILPDSTLLVGHQGSVNWYDHRSGSFGLVANRTGMDIGRTYFLHPAGRDTLLMGTREGLLSVTRSKAGWAFDALRDAPELRGLKRVSCIRPIGGDTYLMGTLSGRGLLRWDRRRHILRVIPLDPSDRGEVGHGNVVAIRPDRVSPYRFWVATEAGFSLYDDATGRFTHYATVIAGKTARNTVNDLFDDGRHLWMTVSQEGLLRYDKHTRRQHLYTVQDGLPNTALYNLETDARGRLWISSNAGLIIFDTASHRFASITHHDGLPSDEFNRFAVWRDGHTFAFGGIDGLVQLDADHFEWQRSTLPVTITDLQYLDSSRFHPLADLSRGITLPHHANTFTLGFAILDFRQPGYHRYRYRLLGWDRGWIHGETRNTVTYSNLSPGEYTFLVEPDDGHAHDGVPTTRLAIRVVPRWYQTVLFKTASVLALLTLLALTARFYILYRTRRRQAEIERKLAIQYERKRISADLHDEIGSTLSSVNIYAGMARQQLEDKGLLHPIIDNVNQVIQRLDELVWSIRPTQDTLGTLIERFSTFATPTARSLGVDLVMEGATGNEGVLLEPDTRHHLYMMMKELVNNAIRHSGCRSVRVAVLREGDTLMVMVQDDGHGFDAGKASRNRNGLRNLQMRAEEMRARFDVQSKVGSGTIARIRVPLSN